MMNQGFLGLPEEYNTDLYREKLDKQFKKNYKLERDEWYKQVEERCRSYFFKREGKA